jgi:F-type H+-transporting ATPase subunit epsilon
MMDLIPVEIVTPNGLIFNKEVKSVILPGKDGEFGVLPSHASLLTTLKDGIVEVEKEDGSKEIIAIKWGYAKVDGNKLTILVQQAVYVSGDGEGELKKSLQEAKELVKSMGDNDVALASTMSKIEKAS